MTTKILAQFNTENEIHLIIDNSDELSNVLISRIKLILDSGAIPVLINKSFKKNFSESIFLNSVEYVEKLKKLVIINEEFKIDDLFKLGRAEVDKVVDKVFVLLSKNENKDDENSNDEDLNINLKELIYSTCIKNRIPINTLNYSKFSTFTMLSTYNNGSLQIGITTNSQGCKISNRLKREVVKNLPPDIDLIIKNVGLLRSIIKNSNNDKKRKLKWLSQIIDYYPLTELGKISIENLDDAINLPAINFENLQEKKKEGKISLVGSGPGSISMLTIGALNAIYESDLILADKLVPQEIIDLIPQKSKLFIARKFPGNADKAQAELLEIGLDGLKKGLNVVRLKQGDPYIFGRGGEEWLFFKKHGYKVNVLPGLNSAFVATALSNIPTTHRGVADQAMICTGVGIKGSIPSNLPLFEEKRTVIFLMSIKRIVDILPILTKEKSWPLDLPVAIVERASCGDQRIIRTRLKDLVEVCNLIESRPPGLIITGWACNILEELKEDEKFRIEENNNRINEEVDLKKITGLIN